MASATLPNFDNTMRAGALVLSAGLLLAGLCITAAGATAVQPAQDAAAAGWSETGEASWYGPRHEGIRTTSGERFDSRRMTAAHPTLPLGSYVRVTLTGSGKSIVVKVNDREPPHGVRCIDLSRAAAARLGFEKRGLADVTLARATREEATELAEAPVVRRHSRRRRG